MMLCARVRVWACTHVTINVGEILYLLQPLKQVPGCCITTGLDVDVGLGDEDERLLLPQARASIGGGRGDASPHFSAWEELSPLHFSVQKIAGHTA